MIHPRPSPIAAALYTLRDMEVDVIVMHGPAGCCFRTGRLLEDEGIRVITTAMGENDYIFGAAQKLTDTIIEAYETFHPKNIGVVGTCASMIIGENMHEAAMDAGVDANIIVVESHAGYSEGDNTAGAILALNAAKEAGIISEEEVERQTTMLEKATELEKSRGMAKGEYIQPDYGDNKVKIAKIILDALRLCKIAHCGGLRRGFYVFVRSEMIWNKCDFSFIEHVLLAERRKNLNCHRSRYVVAKYKIKRSHYQLPGFDFFQSGVSRQDFLSLSHAHIIINLSVRISAKIIICRCGL